MVRAFGGSRIRAAVLVVASGILLVTSFNGRTLADGGTADQPPELLTFEVASYQGAYYTLTGTVQDEWPDGCYVAFGGALAGWYGMVRSDGSFGEVFEVEYMDGGPVSAQVVDPYGYESNLLWNDLH